MRYETEEIDVKAYRPEEIAAKINRASSRLSINGRKLVAVVPMVTSHFSTAPKRYETTRLLLIFEEGDL